MKNLHTIALFLTLTSCISQSADDNGWITATGSRREDNRRQRRVQQSAQQKQEVRKNPRSAWHNRAAVVATVVCGRGTTRTVALSQQPQRRTAREEALPVVAPVAPEKPWSKPCKPRKPSEYLGIVNRTLKSKECYEKEMEKYEQDYAQYEENLAAYEKKMAEYEAARPVYESAWPDLTASTTTS